MPKMTLLELTQNILSAIDGDAVNSISDTVESLQVATVIKETYEEQFNNISMPDFKGLVQFEGLADTDKPNYMKVPSTVRSFDWVVYRDERNSNRFTEVSFQTPEQFLERMFQYDSASGDVFLTTDPVSGVEYYIKTNKSPSFYTLFDNNYIAFDSYDVDYESTLHASKSAAYGTKNQEFTLEDDFIPNLDDNLFPLLLAEAKSVCFVNQKQISSSKEEQRARRQRIRMQSDQYKSKAQQVRTRKEFNYARNR